MERAVGEQEPPLVVLDVHRGVGVVHEPAEPVIGAGYGNEIAHVHDCLRAGLPESPWVPAAQTLTILEQIEDIRVQVGASPHPAA